MIALYTVFYNSVKVHKTLRVAPAIEAGLIDRVLTFEDIVTIIDAVTPKPVKRGLSKKTRQIQPRRKKRWSPLP